MASVNTSFGTQSPPLESTPGGEQPLGVSSIRGDKPQGVPDREQRKGYFKDESTSATQQSGSTESEFMAPQKVGKVKQD
ncbi:uncharacterized protein BXZ73DRAFT_98123 [Epithele typhae]|uniref:uncharacterized protein n=1 Tax=Epithele typhae TaxID=378194 RepID=UPI002007F7C1|nr:uncharacterized protein BXZ73DRAFT_98123 [Epithele typhae]KAH9941728.1 hypothetical protein BXZ73DRAFT_98123 [Epithele typhae]